MQTRLIVRPQQPRAAWALEQAGIHPLLAQLLAARGVNRADELDDALARLDAPALLSGAAQAAVRLADALLAGQRLCVIADYDCDGATACALALRGLALLGARPEQLSYVVPDRAIHGYGLTPAIVDLSVARGAQLLITVDNGIASLEGVAHAKAQGLAVIITDHHLAATDAQGQVVLPAADVIVNPNQPGCGFPSKHLAGVGVMFYVLLALRAELRKRGAYAQSEQPRLDTLLDLVALGTVADVVKLDANNRRLVAQGLKRIRQGKTQAGIAALFAVAGRPIERASTQDFGYTLGPRINAAGRMADMTLGIECLSTTDPTRAAELATQLDLINRQRQEVESSMRAQADELLASLMASAQQMQDMSALALFDAQFHEGVVGILASRLKDYFHRPTIVFARSQSGQLKGSGRSIAGFHLRDALDLISKREPQLLQKFGGHAMAAGCTIGSEDFARFSKAFTQVAQEQLRELGLSKQLLVDGPLASTWFDPAAVQLMDAQVWGPSFEAPVFCDRVEVIAQRLVGEKHLKLSVRLGSEVREAIWFGHQERLDSPIYLAYRVQMDEYQGRQRVQMIVQAASAELG